ncbi:MAG: ADOP family duplicated permease [Gemmatimonadaceae bacterium]
MTRIPDLRRLFRLPTTTKRVADEVSDEVAFHLEMQARDLEAQGLGPADARAEALRRFGDVSAAREELGAIDRRRVRRAWRAEWWEVLLNDVRYSARTLRRDARLTLFAVLIVGLGVGASVTVFSVVNALLVRPLPFRDPDRLVWISNGDAHDLSARTTQVRHVWTLQRESRTLADVAGYSEFFGDGDHALVSGAGEPERLTRVEVTQNFFPLLGVQPIVGRLFAPEEALSRRPGAVILSHRLWQRRFASDPGIVGRKLTVDGVPVTVVGVLPASFDFGTIFAPGRRVDYYSPYPLSAETNRQGNMLALIGRLRFGATPELAEREAIALVSAVPPGAERYNEFHPQIRSLRAHVSGAFRPALLALAGAVVLVMMMVCANLSNLLLTRSAAREREVAVRVALGADRARLVRQYLTESVVLSAAGSALGLLLAIGGTRLLADAQSIRLPLLDQVRVDWPALGFALVATVTTGILFGMAPALRVSAVAVQDTLKSTGLSASSSRRHDWLRGALVVAEVAIACTLLVGAGLLTRSFLRVLDQDLGFRPESVVAIRIDPSTKFTSAEQRLAYLDDALDRVRAAPEIRAAALTDVLPMGFNRMWTVKAVGTAATGERSPAAFLRVVSEGYFSAMGVGVRAGRDFTSSDDAKGRPVIIVNDVFARRLWPGKDPIGQSVETSGSVRQVVGVVPGLRYQSLEEQAGADMYFPMRQMPDYDAVYVLARSTLPQGSVVAAVRAVLRPKDPTLPLTEVRTMQGIVEQSVSPRRFIVMLIIGFAGFALVLASLGIYAVVSYGVVQRRREIGIRMALGASPLDVQRRVLVRTLGLATVGLSIGLAASWALARVMQSLLFGVTFTDPTTFAFAMAALVLVAALAGYLPARRAARLEPAEALRAE